MTISLSRKNSPISNESGWMATCRELRQACWCFSQRNAYEILAERIFKQNSGINAIMVEPLAILIHRKKG